MVIWKTNILSGLKSRYKCVGYAMNRRQFFKQVAATCAGIVGASTMAPAVGWGGDRSVVWGKATRDLPKGLIGMCFRQNWWQYSYKEKGWHLVYVEATEPIKKGQALVWNPDGTVRGGEPEPSCSRITEVIFSPGFGKPNKFFHVGGRGHWQEYNIFPTEADRLKYRAECGL